ncbi:MAG: HAD-IIIA family hydrolase [Thermoplasmatota archaeon]
MAKFTVFLDRDGVFNVLKLPGIRYVRDLEWLPGAKEAFAKLNRGDVQTALCTNQPTVGLLLSTPGMIHRVNGHLKAELEAAGGELPVVEAAFSPTWFPHRRRKPRPGMLEDAAAKLGHVDKSRAVMIGDTIKDLQAATAFGIPGILLATTYTEEQLRAKAEAKGVVPEAILPGLPEAVEWVLKQL